MMNNVSQVCKQEVIKHQNNTIVLIINETRCELGYKKFVYVKYSNRLGD
jgi:hypothetical protein